MRTSSNALSSNAFFAIYVEIIVWSTMFEPRNLLIHSPSVLSGIPAVLWSCCVASGALFWAATAIIPTVERARIEEKCIWVSEFVLRLELLKRFRRRWFQVKEKSVEQTIEIDVENSGKETRKQANRRKASQFSSLQAKAFISLLWFKKNYSFILAVEK